MKIDTCEQSTGMHEYPKISGGIMAFERYNRSGKTGQAFATILERGQISLNQGTINLFKVKDYKFAILLYDAETQRIGVMLTNDETEEGAKLLIKLPNSVVISARDFMNIYGINYANTQRYLVEQSEIANLYAIDLKKPFPARASAARKAAQQPETRMATTQDGDNG